MNTVRFLFRYTAYTFFALALLFSCSKDDDNAPAGPVELKGTVWSGRFHITPSPEQDAQWFSLQFTDDEEFVWYDLSGEYYGTYSFTDGKNLRLTFSDNTSASATVEGNALKDVVNGEPGRDIENGFKSAEFPADKLLNKLYLFTNTERPEVKAIVEFKGADNVLVDGEKATINDNGSAMLLTWSGGSLFLLEEEAKLVGGSRFEENHEFYTASEGNNSAWNEWLKGSVWGGTYLYDGVGAKALPFSITLKDDNTFDWYEFSGPYAGTWTNEANVVTLTFASGAKVKANVAGPLWKDFQNLTEADWRILKAFKSKPVDVAALASTTWNLTGNGVTDHIIFLDGPASLLYGLYASTETKVEGAGVVTKHTYAHYYAGEFPSTAIVNQYLVFNGAELVGIRQYTETAIGINNQLIELTGARVD